MATKLKKLFNHIDLESDWKLYLNGTFDLWVKLKMLKKIITGLNKANFKKLVKLNFGKTNKEKSGGKIDEFDFMVKTNRIVDCATFDFKIKDGLKLGIYQDTYASIIANHSAKLAVENILNVLEQVQSAYKKLLLTKFRAKDTADFMEMRPELKFARYQTLFKVHSLKHVEDLNDQVLCLNLLTRTDEEPFLVIGKRPKGKKDIKDYWNKSKAQRKV